MTTASDRQQASSRPDPDRVAALAAEIIEVSGNYGFRADRLDKAPLLLQLSSLDAAAGADRQLQALQLVRSIVNGWSDAKGREILLAALGFEHALERGRPRRLDLLAAELNAREAPTGTLGGALLDTTFTSRLAPDLAAALLHTEEPNGRGRSRWRLAALLVLLLLAILVGLGGWRLTRNRTVGTTVGPTASSSTEATTTLASTPPTRPPVPAPLVDALAVNAVDGRTHVAVEAGSCLFRVTGRWVSNRGSSTPLYAEVDRLDASKPDNWFVQEATMNSDGTWAAEIYVQSSAPGQEFQVRAVLFDRPISRSLFDAALRAADAGPFGPGLTSEPVRFAAANSCGGG